MPAFRYSLNLDGEQQPIVGSNSSTTAAAVGYGRAMLMAAVRAPGRQWAWCVVHAADRLAPEPLGIWDWSADAARPVWTKADS